ncbi:MAG: ABC transporter permease [Sphingobacteriales bacterium]|nr:MAG: ABC transporter permease [Sphingobacteriales bacterium]
MEIHSGRPMPLTAYLKYLFQYREFILTLVGRAFKIRYAQTFLGSLWLVLQPLINLAIFVLLFDRLLGIYSGRAPYALFAFCGLLGWNLFSHLSNQGSSAIIYNQDLVKRLSFPKLTLVITQILTGLLDFAIGFAILLLGTVVLGNGLHASLLLLPVFILINLSTGTAIALLMNIVAIKHRDYYQALPYLLNFGIWITPVFYPVSIIPEHYRFLLYFNPMAGVIEGYRWCVLQEGKLDMGFLPVYLITFVLLGLGFYLFKQKEPTFINSL